MKGPSSVDLRAPHDERMAADEGADLGQHPWRTMSSAVWRV
jgi:hypothetical protein